MGRNQQEWMRLNRKTLGEELMDENKPQGRKKVGGVIPPTTPTNPIRKILNRLGRKGPE